MRGPPAGVSFSCTTASAKRRLHDVAEHFLADLLAELLAHDLHRHLAGRKPFRRTVRLIVCSRSSTAFSIAFGGNLDFHPALQRAGRLYRNLHGSKNLC